MGEEEAMANLRCLRERVVEVWRPSQPKQGILMAIDELLAEHEAGAAFARAASTLERLDHPGAANGSAPRDEKVARNQILIRAVEHRINDFIARGGLPGRRLDFRCECVDLNCAETITLTPQEYSAIRAVPTRFPVKQGHLQRGRERVVETYKEYAVVARPAERE